jgi:hypothetical protein
VLYSVDDEVVFGKPGAASFQPALPPPVAAPPPASPQTPAPNATQPAQAEKVRTRFVASFELDHQFNAIATITYADGTTASLGDALFGLNAGAAFPLTSDGRFELQGLIGIQLGRVNASNGSANFWDFPLEITAHVNAGHFRIGAGPALHISPLLRGDGFASGSDTNFDTTVGVVGRVEYQFNRSSASGCTAPGCGSRPTAPRRTPAASGPSSAFISRGVPPG